MTSDILVNSPAPQIKCTFGMLINKMWINSENVFPNDEPMELNKDGDFAALYMSLTITFINTQFDNKHIFCRSTPYYGLSFKDSWFFKDMWFKDKKVYFPENRSLFDIVKQYVEYMHTPNNKKCLKDIFLYSTDEEIKEILKIKTLEIRYSQQRLNNNQYYTISRVFDIIGKKNLLTDILAEATYKEFLCIDDKLTHIESHLTKKELLNYILNNIHQPINIIYKAAVNKKICTNKNKKQHKKDIMMHTPKQHKYMYIPKHQKHIFKNNTK